MLAVNKDVVTYQTTVGASSSSSAFTGMGMGGGSNKGAGSIMVKLKSNSNVDACIEILKNQIKVNDGNARINILEANPSGGGMGSNSISVSITGNDINKIKESATLLTKSFQSVEGLDKVINNLGVSKPEILVNVDQKKSSSYGLSTDDVLKFVQAMVNDSPVTTIEDGNNSMSVLLGVKANPITKADDIGALVIKPGVRISDVATINEVLGL